MTLATQAYFVTGTDTGVGKTWVSLHLLEYFKAQGKRVVAMKPIASGAVLVDGKLRNQDALDLIEHTNVEVPYELVNPYCFAAALAPHIASNMDNTIIDIEHIFKCYQQLTKLADVIIVEGVGGWAVPINAKQELSDVVKRLDIPVLCVVGLRLGCINHAILTAQAIELAQCQLSGWIANTIDKDMIALDDVLATLRNKLNAPLLSCLSFSSLLNSVDKKINFNLYT